jgi:tetratricopeptide (TPR) repeat protein
MINLLVSLGAGLVTALLIKLGGFPLLAGIIPGTLVFVGLYIVLARRTFTQLQVVMTQVQTELSSMPPTPKEQKAKAEKAIKLLESALPLGRWQYLVEGQVQAQIGMLRYLFKEHDAALAAFLKMGAGAWSSNPHARAMQAAIYFQKKDFASMEKTFEDAVKAGQKEGILWAAYAWCLQANKETEKALKVLSRAVEANPSDEKLKNALTALQNDKKLKMKAWEPTWWQFGLEPPPMQQPQFANFGGRRRFARR